jgi:hypothetical protein
MPDPILGCVLNLRRRAGVAAAVAKEDVVMGEVSAEVLASLSTPDRVESRIGELEFTDGAPARKTVETLYEHLDFVHAVNAFLAAFPAASTHALREGFRSVGAADNSVLIFSELMDSSSRFLTANADTVYYVGIIDLTNGPMVVETPPMALGTFDDMWFHWIIDFGMPGPDRGAGGKFVLTPPAYDGPLPEGGFYVGHSRTNRVLMLGRSFIVDDDPAPTVATIKSALKIYPYVPGGPGTSIATLLQGEIPPPGPPAAVADTVFVEGSGLTFNTIPPTDGRFFETVHALLQDEPADAGDPEITGHLAEIGIVKGKPFNPDDRMRAILDDAAAVGNATARALTFDPRGEENEVYFYDNSAWTNMLFNSGYLFDRPIPQVTPEGIKPHPPTGARTHDIRTLFFYGYTGITPAMAMRLTGIGSQYLVTFMDANNEYFDGSRTYTVTLPRDIPQARFWSLTLYDNQTRSMLVTAQRYPRAGSQAYPTPAAVADPDGSTTIHVGPQQPDGVADGNWIQTVPGKGFFVILRLYSPLPAFFDKTWQVGEFVPSN